MSVCILIDPETGFYTPINASFSLHVIPTSEVRSNACNLQYIIYVKIFYTQQVPWYWVHVYLWIHYICILAAYALCAYHTKPNK